MITDTLSNTSRRFAWRRGIVLALACLAGFHLASTPVAAAEKLQFNRDIRRILSDNCLRCHGFDSKERKGSKGGLRLDTFEGATADHGGKRAIVPGDPGHSEALQRILSSDVDERMPPTKSGKKLSASEVALLKQWIKEGATYSRHWSYVKPVRPALPPVSEPGWPVNGLDRFVLARLDKEGLKHAPSADAYALARRVSLDLTGLPPTVEELDAFVADKAPGAYERYVDRLLGKTAFGEHWARMWLDHARYADSTGYADDPGRTIWAFRDYVIRSLNANKPFDQFTLEQLAGDLFPNPSEEQLIATAFHRNTMTNNEGGTNDEEFRNVAVVDRVNTTLAVWMGTTMACAQCHDHKYDPISQEEYFRVFAILNNTEDADRSDESPTLPVFTDDQKRQKAAWESELKQLETTLSTPTPALAKEQRQWEQRMESPLDWTPIKPDELSSKSGAAVAANEAGVIRAERKAKTDAYSMRFGVQKPMKIAGVKLTTEPGAGLTNGGAGHAEGDFAVTRVDARILPAKNAKPKARYLRIELSGNGRILSLAEVQAFSSNENVALRGEATQSSTAFDGPAKLAIDGKTDGRYAEGKSTTHTDTSTDPWWEVDLKSPASVDRIVVWNRTDSGVENRLSNFRISLLDEQRSTVWSETVARYPNPSSEFSPNGSIPITFVAAGADFSANNANLHDLFAGTENKGPGWSVAGQIGQPHMLILAASTPAEINPGDTLQVVVEQNSKREYATLASFRIEVTADPRALDFAAIPPSVASILRTPSAKRTAAETAAVASFYPKVAPALKASRDRQSEVSRLLADMKPATTVPVMRQLTGDKRRKTQIQRRGNFMDLGKEVSEGVPASFTDGEGKASTRMDLARWLISPENPLTARVVVNHFWESIFGIGLVRTSEEFGAQGEPPSHPELLDWMARELIESGWDIKHLLKVMVTSATYRQSSKVSPELADTDPDNRLLARGPRFRLSAESIRDQALFASGLLSRKMFGTPVKPQQPKQGLSAAFGSGIDWETSQGEDRYRRGLYTTWRRSNPYPSMAAFDAPNREVCTVRRERSNTPLQALVTLNDPVYVEAAEALAQRMMDVSGTTADRVRHGFRRCAGRPPEARELEGMVQLYERALKRYQADPEKARKLLAVNMQSAVAGNGKETERAAWTVVGNVLLNLDEVLMRR